MDPLDCDSENPGDAPPRLVQGDSLACTSMNGKIAAARLAGSVDITMPFGANDPGEIGFF